MTRGPGARFRPYSPGRPLALAMVAVVVSFAASLALSHGSARSIDREVVDIAGNAAPSITHLAYARTELRRLATYPSLYLAWKTEGAETSRANIEGARRRLGQEWAAYGALPKLAGEAGMVAAAAEQLAPLSVVVDRVLALIDAGDFSGARVLWHSDMLPAIDRVDASIERLIEHNAQYTRARAEEIARLRHRAAMNGLALGLISVALALGATLMAFATLRRHDRLVAERNLLLQARADELEQFASRVAHDIKSPLGAVGLALHVARRQGEDERVHKVTTRALASLKRVQQITDGLLAFAMAGARPAGAMASPLCSVVDEVLDELRPAADEHGITISIQRAEALWVACAPGTVASLVSNLLRNAIKFTAEQPRRRVEVRVSDRGARARFEVHDTGPGVPPELHALIFEPYVRAAAAGQPGIGLGLATVKRLAEAHGGAVGLRSVVGEGSCFWFELPKAEPRIDTPDDDAQRDGAAELTNAAAPP